MDKMRMESVNISKKNIDKIGNLFPGCITETKDKDGNLKRSINFDLLKQMLSDVVDENDEVYEFSWVGKKAAIIEANKSIRKTLRPYKEKSVDWDNTENLYIEGKNVEVLKLLQESYLHSIKMIYIDPPYNTGNNIIYPNDYSASIDDYRKESGLVDKDGNILIKNTDSNGRFHSDWCSMMFSVLLLSRNLLSPEGYIALAIDDNELFTLKMICDEVFGEHNFIGTLVTRCNPQGRNKNNLDPVHEYHLLYAKDLLSMPLLKIKKPDSTLDYRYLMRSGTNSRKFERPYRYFPMLVKDGKVSTIEKEEYERIYSKNKTFDESYLTQLKEKYEDMGYMFILPISKDGEEKVWQRTFERVTVECDSYIYDNGQIKVPPENTRTPISLWTDDKYSNVSNGTNKLKELFGDKTPFDFSKSIYTVKDLISLNTSGNDIILDFFSGSATTAHATMLLNSEDGSHRRFIMVQIPEPISETADAYKMGYRVISDVGEDRIRKAGSKIKEASHLLSNNFDVGFRVFKLDSSNMTDVFYSPADYSQGFLNQLESNIKPDRTDLDLLFGCLLEWGLPLSLPYSSEQIEGCTVHNYNDGDLIACFDDNVPDSVIKAIAQKQPLRAVFRDSSFTNSPLVLQKSMLGKFLNYWLQTRE